MPDPLEVESSSIDFNPIRDPRKHMPDLPPVLVEAVEDVELYAVAGLEKELDGFYIDLLKFERVTASFNQYTQKRAAEYNNPCIIYRGENALVFFEVIEVPPLREDFRPLQLQIWHFNDFIEAIEKLELEYERQRGITPGLERILLQDPAGNWVSITHRRAIL